MRLFNDGEEGASGYQSHLEMIDSVITTLQPLAPDSDILSINNLRANFEHKIVDFFREERKLNIGIIGQVKAGKSSFLNALLFDGKPVLPKASTPKTAALTKIEYSPDNKMQVEYYSVEDWDTLKQLASVNSEGDIYRSARELLKMASDSGLNAEEILSKRTEDIEFDSIDGLLGKMNEYVGENGTYTPFVKAVTLYMDKEELKGISIVDTPGINDTIQSRTQRTNEFIELCDVVFFLSQSSYFLTKLDWTLLSTQLPQKGAQRLILVASKFDNAVRNILSEQSQISTASSEDADIFDEPEAEPISTAEAVKQAKLRLSNRANERVAEYVEDMRRRDYDKSIIDIVAGCKTPHFISSICRNIAAKPADNLDEEEQIVYSALSKYSADTVSDVQRLGDFSGLLQEFEEIVVKKKEILGVKSISFIRNSENELHELLSSISERETQQLKVLKNSDLSEINTAMASAQSKINTIHAHIGEIFGELSEELEKKKVEIVRDIRSNIENFNRIDEKTETHTVQKSREVRDPGFWFWQWFRKKTEYYTQNEQISYVDASDACKNIANFSNMAINSVEQIFLDVINYSALKRKLLGAIVSNFDTTDSNFDPAFYKRLTSEAISGIELPIITFDFTGEQNAISARFSGKITNGAKASELNNLLSETVAIVATKLIEVVSREIRSFKDKIATLSDALRENLLVNIKREFEALQKKYDDYETEIKNAESYITRIAETEKTLVH